MLSSECNATLNMLHEDLGATADFERVVRRILDTMFPTEEARIAMAGEIKAAREVVRSLLQNDDAKSVRPVIARLAQSAVERSRPLATEAPHVPRDVNDIPDTVRRGLASCWSGSGQEIDWSVLWCKQNQQIIGSWDAWGFTTVSGKRVTRQELRENAAPRNEMREKFLLSLPRIPEAHA